MARIKCISLLAAMALAVLYSTNGCSGPSTTTTSNGDVPLVLTVHDLPASASVLNFQIRITGVSLQTGLAMTGSVNVLPNPISVNLSNLMTQRELLVSTKVPSGTYTGMTITFSQPSVTIFNSSGAAITLGTSSCAANTTCQFSPSFNQSSSSITSSPFPMTLASATPVAIDIDFNINSSLQSNFTLTPTVTATANTSALVDGNLTDISGVTGQITKVGNNQVTITDSNTGQTVTFNANSGTKFGSFTNCAAGDFTCLKTNQLVTTNLGVGMDGNTLTAVSITPFNGFTQGISGTVISKNTSTGSINLIVNSAAPAVSGISNGQMITVNPATNTMFGIMGGATAPSGTSFSSLNDVVPGQTLFVDSTGITPGSGATNAVVTTGQIQLTPTQFSGTINTLNNPNFMVNGLNGFFTGNGVNAIQVNTGANTSFTNVTGSSFAGLTTGSTVNVGGVLLNSSAGPVVVGSQVNGVSTTTTTAVTEENGKLTRLAQYIKRLAEVIAEVIAVGNGSTSVMAAISERGQAHEPGD